MKYIEEKKYNVTLMNTLIHIKQKKKHILKLSMIFKNTPINVLTNIHPLLRELISSRSITIGLITNSCYVQYA